MKKMRRLLSVVLAILVMCSVFFAMPTTVSAAREACKTQDEAVSWLNGQNNATYDFDGSYGTQCTEFVKAYVNWLLSGNAWQDCWNRKTFDGKDIWKNSLWTELDWKVYDNTSDFMPQPGDIFSAGISNSNHTGVVISSNLNTAKIADANARTAAWQNGDPVYVHDINWRSASADSPYGATHYIRPVFKSTPPIPTSHNPEGYLDGVQSPAPGKLRVWGWALDRDDVHAAIDVHIYVGGNSGSGSPRYVIKANKPRSDLSTNLPGVGINHGFDETLTVSRYGSQAVYAYGINIGGGTDNPNLTLSPKTADIKRLTGSIEVADGDYYIGNATDNKKVLSIKDKSTANYANVQIAQRVECEESQIFTVKHLSNGFYSIMNKKSGYFLDVDNAGQNPGVNVRQHYGNDSDAQKWVIQQAGDYKFRIISNCNYLSLDLEGGNTTEGTNVRMWSENDSDAEKWRFIPVSYESDRILEDGDYKITSSLGDDLCLDTMGGSGQNNSNIQIWKNNRQTYQLKYVGLGLYNITFPSTDRNIDVISNGSYMGINVQLCNKNESNAQRWIIRPAGDGLYNIIHKGSGLYLSVENGTAENGANVRLWNNNNKPAQKWKITPMDTLKTGEHNNHKYEFYKYKMSWNQAYNFCEKRGGHLVTVNSKEESEYINTLVGEYDGKLWTGGTTVDSKEWKWANGESFEYNNLSAEDLSFSNEGKDCIYFDYSDDANGDWKTDSRESYKIGGFICEYGNEIDINEIHPEFINLYNGHEYWYFDDGVDWQTAKNVCDSLGGHLVTIDNAAENTAVFSNMDKLSKEEIWIGYKRNNDNKWIDCNGELINYDNWSENEPNNTDEIELYAEMYKNGKWNDLRGYGFLYHFMGFVCEFDKINMFNDDGSRSINPVKTFTSGNYTYELFDVPLTWNNAKEACEKMGGHLVTITSQDEQDIIEFMLSKGTKLQYWLGLTDCKSGTEWITGEKIDFDNWASGEPNVSKRADGEVENFAQILNKDNPKSISGKRFKWNDSFNDNLFPGEEDYFSLGNVGFICEYDEFSKPEPSTEPSIPVTDNPTESSETEPVTDKPTEPIEAQPITDKPTDPTEIEAVTDDSTEPTRLANYNPTEPVTHAPTESVTTEPATDSSTEPITKKPTEPVTTESITDKPTESVATEPVTDKATELVTTEPVTDKPTKPQQTEPQPTVPVTEPTEPAVESLEKGASVTQVEKFVTTLKNDIDPNGSTFHLLSAKQKKVAKNSISITWSKVKGAKDYVVFGAKCGSKYKKLATVKNTTFTQKKLKKNTYYKYLVVAFDKSGKMIATSKMLHIATTGGKNGNAKSVSSKPSSIKLKVKKSKTLKIIVKATSKKVKIKNHRKIAFESSNPKIAKVNSKGKVAAKKKGTCYIYAYAQNGIFKKIKVTVTK